MSDATGCSKIIKNVNVNVTVTEHDLVEIIRACDDTTALAGVAVQAVMKIRRLRDLKLNDDDFKHTVDFYKDRGNGHMLRLISMIDRCADEVIGSESKISEDNREFDRARQLN